MRQLVIYYDGNEFRAKLIVDTTEVDTSEPFSAGDFGLDEECDLTCVVELSDDVRPTVYGPEADVWEI